MTYSITNLPPLTGDAEHTAKGHKARASIILQLDVYFDTRADLGPDYAAEVERIRPIMHGAILRQTDAHSWVIDGMSHMHGVLHEMMTQEEIDAIDAIDAELHGATADQRLAKQRAAEQARYSLVNLPPLHGTAEQVDKGAAARARFIERLHDYLARRGGLGRDYTVENNRTRSIVFRAVVRQTDAQVWCAIGGSGWSVQGALYELMNERENGQVEAIRAELHGATVGEQIEKRRAAGDLAQSGGKRDGLVVGVELWPALTHHGWVGQDTALNRSPQGSGVRSIDSVYRREAQPSDGPEAADVITLTCFTPTVVADVAFNGRPVADADELWRIVTGQDSPDRSAYLSPSADAAPPF